MLQSKKKISKNFLVYVFIIIGDSSSGHDTKCHFI